MPTNPRHLPTSTDNGPTLRRWSSRAHHGNLTSGDAPAQPRQHVPATKLLSIATLVAVSTLLLACGGSSSTPTPTSTAGTLQPASTATAPAGTATVAAPSPTVPAPSPTVPTGAPASPTNLRITGALPDLHTPVPPGEGEQGRLTVSWQDNSNNETGFRLYQDCGTVTTLTEVDPNTTSIGPIQTCRPGRLGVAAFNASGASAIIWSP